MRRPFRRPAVSSIAGPASPAVGSTRALALLCLSLPLLVPAPAAAQMLRGRLDERARPTEQWDDRRPQAPAARVTVPRLADDADLDAASRVFDDGTRVDLIRDPAVRAGAPTPATGAPTGAATGTAAAPGVAARARPVRRPPPGRVAPVAPFEPAVATRPLTPVAASQPTPRDPRADERAEAEKEDDAYLPLGLRSGGMTWRPAVEIAAGRSTNVDGRRNGRPSTLWQIAPELVGTSDWSRHALEVSLRGSQTGYTAAPEQEKPMLRAEMRGRVDLSELTTVELTALWSRERQSSSTAENSGSTYVAPDLDTATLGLGATRDVGLLAVTLRGGLERSDYRSRSPDAGSESENNTRWTAALRTTLGPQAPIRPFVEAQVSHRVYDEAIVNGARRDTDGGRLSTGIVADMGPVLRGEIAAGWASERPKDSGLATMSDWTLDGTLTWSPTRVDKVKLETKTAFVPTTLLGSPGAVQRSLGITWDHALRADIVGSAGVTWTTKRYVAVDTDERSLLLSSGLTYKFNRNLQTFLRGTWEFAGTTGSPDYQVGTVLAGVRVQR